MSEDSVSYGNPEKDIYSIEFDGDCNEQRLFDTAQKILLSNLANSKYVQKAVEFSNLSRNASQQELDECFGYSVDRESICDEFAVFQSIGLAKLFMRRYEEAIK